MIYTFEPIQIVKYSSWKVNIHGYMEASNIKTEKNQTCNLAVFQINIYDHFDKRICHKYF